MLLIINKSRYTYPLDLVVAFVACGRDKFFETIFAVKLSFFLDKADVLKRTTALSVNADKVIGAPNLTQSTYEGPSMII